MCYQLSEVHIFKTHTYSTLCIQIQLFNFSSQIQRRWFVMCYVLWLAANCYEESMHSMYTADICDQFTVATSTRHPCAHRLRLLCRNHMLVVCGGGGGGGGAEFKYLLFRPSCFVWKQSKYIPVFILLVHYFQLSSI